MWLYFIVAMVLSGRANGSLGSKYTFNEIGAGLVTGWTGSTLNVAEYDFPAYIYFSAVISVNAEVVSVKEGSFMIPITYTMEFHFLRNSCRIFA